MVLVIFPPGAAFLSPPASESVDSIVKLGEEKVKSLTTLAYSDNTDLQKSAALCFSEISENC